MLAAIFFGAAVGYLYYLWDIYSYWRRKSITGPTPLPLFGNYASVLFGIKDEYQLIHDIYRAYPNEKCVGLYRGTTPVLLTRDPELIKHVLVSDHKVFFERNLIPGGVLFHKNQVGTNDFDKYMAYRKAYSPLYTHNKIGRTMPLSKTPLNKYLQFVDNMVDRGVDHDITLIERKFALEVGGAMTVGREVGCFSEDSSIEAQSQKFNNRFLLQKHLYRVAVVLPWIFKIANPLINATVQTMYNFYYGIIYGLLKGNSDRKKDGISFLDLIADKRNTNSDAKDVKINQYPVDDDAVIEQCIVHWVVNSTTTAHAVSAALYELAHSEHAQDTVRKEIDEVLSKHNGDLSMKAILVMNYLEAVIHEILRMYTVNGCIHRVCLKKYTFPRSTLSIEKGTLIVIPQNGLHNDSKYFVEPHVFDPERFTENKAKIPKYVYMPFGEGPRNCIAPRLVKTVLALGIASLLHRFRVAPPTQKKVKVKSPYNLGDNIPGGLWVRIYRRD